MREIKFSMKKAEKTDLDEIVKRFRHDLLRASENTQYPELTVEYSIKEEKDEGGIG